MLNFKSTVILEERDFRSHYLNACRIERFCQMQLPDRLVILRCHGFEGIFSDLFRCIIDNRIAFCRNESPFLGLFYANERNHIIFKNTIRHVIPVRRIVLKNRTFLRLNFNRMHRKIHITVGIHGNIRFLCRSVYKILAHKAFES